MNLSKIHEISYINWEEKSKVLFGFVSVNIVLKNHQEREKQFLYIQLPYVNDFCGKLRNGVWVPLS